MNFRTILQPKMREEVKEACYHLLGKEAVSTVLHRVTFASYFSVFLLARYPDTESFTQITRGQIEDYLTYLKTECQRKQTYAAEIALLKSLLAEIGWLNDVPGLENLFLRSDGQRRTAALYRTYSDAELSRLHDCILQLPEQLARLLFIHELLGTRISDALTLRMDALIKNGDRWTLRIDQVKTRHSYFKPLNATLYELLKASIAYTKEHSPDSPYIFPDNANPQIPIQYGYLRNTLQKTYQANNLVDDLGKPMRVGTHLFRHTYGQKLTDLDIEDNVIARLLGHKSPSSVKHYRKISDRKMAEETKEMRSYMDQLLKQIMKDYW